MASRKLFQPATAAKLFTTIGRRSAVASARTAFRRSPTVIRSGQLQTLQLSRTLVRVGPTAARSLSTATVPEMFCYQCEQTENQTGCTTIGNCGKTPQTAAMQDLLIHILKRVGQVAHVARSHGIVDEEVDKFVINGLFSTLTNVNFDPARFQTLIKEAVEHRDSMEMRYQAACEKKKISVADLGQYATWVPHSYDIPALEELGKHFGVLSRNESYGQSVGGVQEMIMYGLKGLAAYASHAYELGAKDEQVFAFVHEALDFLAHGGQRGDMNACLTMLLRVGEVNLRVMQLLDEGHNKNFGQPTPTKVNTNPVQGKCILISGHDMKDLEALLKQTEGKGINIYTHGEMLPGHSYPGLKKYKHLVGNYGGAWQMQKFEFSKFPGPIVVTTNCLREPRQSYADRIYTMNEVGWPEIKHIDNRDFSKVIEQAQTMEGFAETKPAKELLIGFGHQTVLGVADKVLGAVSEGNLKRIVLIGGCDGAEGERNYYKQLAQSLPKETMILTLGCGKYRINKLDLGNVPNSELPRLIDMGQCNDSYGAIVVASELAKALNTDVNSLPLSLALSWFEQKAVAVLLTLLHLGIKNIRIGPNLPGFVTPEVLQVLQEKFALKPVDTIHVTEDVKRIMMGN